jgi:hypothetical protein
MRYQMPRLHAFGSDTKHGTCIPGTQATSDCSYGSIDYNAACGVGGAALGPGGCVTGTSPKHGCMTGNSAAETCSIGNGVS